MSEQVEEHDPDCPHMGLKADEAGMDVPGCSDCGTAFKLIPIDMTRQQILWAIEKIAEDVGGTVRHSYGGRGMFGDHCFAIDCPNAIRCIEAAAQRGITGAKWDNMGHDFVVYWEDIKPPVSCDTCGGYIDKAEEWENEPCDCKPKVVDDRGNEQ